METNAVCVFCPFAKKIQHKFESQFCSLYHSVTGSVFVDVEVNLADFAVVERRHWHCWCFCNLDSCHFCHGCCDIGCGGDLSLNVLNVLWYPGQHICIFWIIWEFLQACACFRCRNNCHWHTWRGGLLDGCCSLCWLYCRHFFICQENIHCSAHVDLLCCAHFFIQAEAGDRAMTSDGHDLIVREIAAFQECCSCDTNAVVCVDMWEISWIRQLGQEAKQLVCAHSLVVVPDVHVSHFFFLLQTLPMVGALRVEMQHVLEIAGNGVQRMVRNFCHYCCYQLVAGLSVIVHLLILLFDKIVQASW